MQHAQNLSQGASAQLGATHTFDAISDAVGRVRATSAQVQAMLDRISPTPRELPDEMKAIHARQPYSIALQDLHSSLNELGSLLDTLEKHV